LQNVVKDRDLTWYLTLINAVLALGTAGLWLFAAPSSLVSGYSVLLAMALAAQNQFFLLYSRRVDSPFLILAVFGSIFFYQLRVASLLAFPWSSVLPRNPYSAENLSHALLFILAGNLAIFGGTRLGGGGLLPILEYRSDQGRKAAVGIFFIVLLVNVLAKYAGPLQGYIQTFFKLEYALMLTLVCLLRGSRADRAGAKYQLYAMLLVYLVYRTVSGSRSAVLTEVMLLAAAALATRGKIRLSRKVALSLLLVLPVSALLFMAGTRIRNPENPFNVRQIFDRAGFLDMTADLVANAPRYAGVINGAYYAKSVTDNGLTPGFNVFDSPKAANSLSIIYNGYANNSLATVSRNYQSDMLTVYGEAFVLFGPVFGLLALGAVSFLFSAAYRFLSRGGDFAFAALRAMLLYIYYYYFLNSFGADWFFVDLLRGSVPFVLLLWAYTRLQKAWAAETVKG